jgi:hypothetical protein
MTCSSRRVFIRRGIAVLHPAIPHDLGLALDRRQQRAACASALLDKLPIDTWTLVRLWRDGHALQKSRGTGDSVISRRAAASPGQILVSSSAACA